jgi:hypothetical protein
MITAIWFFLGRNWKAVLLGLLVSAVILSIWNYGRNQYNAGRDACLAAQVKAQSEHTEKVNKIFKRIDHAKPSHNDDSGVADRLFQRTVRE